MATRMTQFKKKVTREREVTLDGIINRRETELDDLDRMIDQGLEVEEILKRTKCDTMTVYHRLLDLGVLPLC